MIPRLRIYGVITKQFCRVFRIVGFFCRSEKGTSIFFTVKLKPYTLPVIALYLQIFNAQNYTLLKISQPRVYS